MVCGVFACLPVSPQRSDNVETGDVPQGEDSPDGLVDLEQLAEQRPAGSASELREDVVSTASSDEGDDTLSLV